MRVVLTGATGFLGRHLLEALRVEHEVVALARTPGPAAPGLTWVAQDLTRPLSDALPGRFDAVVHLAQSRRFRELPAGADDVFEVNVHSTHRLLERARGAGCRVFVLASSGGVTMGTPDPRRPLDPFAPESLYFAGKLAAELLTAQYRGQFAVVIARLFFPYGPGLDSNMLLARLAGRIARGEPVDLYGEDGFALNPIHARDATSALSRALRVEGHHLVDLCGPAELSLRAACEAIGRAVGRAPSFVVHPPRPPLRVVGDPSAASALLGPPTLRFEEGAVDLAPRAGGP